MHKGFKKRYVTTISFKIFGISVIVLITLI